MKNKPISGVAVFLVATTAVTLLFWGINKISPDPRYEVKEQPSPIDEHLNRPETKLRPPAGPTGENPGGEQPNTAKKRAETNNPFNPSQKPKDPLNPHPPDDNGASVGTSTKKLTLKELMGGNLPEEPKKKPAQPEKPEDEEKKEQPQKPMNESSND